MDTQQFKLYIQWCQSERVKLLVGGLVGPTEQFLIPRELLLRRSRTFRDLLAGELSSKDIQLPDTPVQTMEAFFVWTLSPQPQIDGRTTFSEVVRLGIFAWRYQISALINQVTDIIRSNLASGHWQLQASMVDDIYETVTAGSPLREVIRAALGGLPRSKVEGEGREEWRATFLKHAQLGWDYLEAGGSVWTSQDYLSGACRFHDHKGVSHQEVSHQEVPHQEESYQEESHQEESHQEVPHQEESYQEESHQEESHQESHQEELFQCAYAREECFPRWEEESMKGRKDEEGWKEWGEERDGEQERCGADEERKEGKLSIEAVVDETEPVAKEVTTEAVEAVTNGVGTEDVANGVETEAAANGVGTEAAANGVTMEDVNSVGTGSVVDGTEGSSVITMEERAKNEKKPKPKKKKGGR